jgi:putative thiamine transport system substrate-binding protein
MPEAVQPHLNRRQAIKTAIHGAGLFWAALGAARASAQSDTPAWRQIESQARGQTVYFNAWGGAPTINAYIAWAGEQLLQRFGVKLVHVKIGDAADMVKRVRNEIRAGKSDGSIDLAWMNGENFLTLKREALLFGPFAEALPAYAKVDTVGKPTTRIDFSEPVDGMEAPWGMAQLTFMADGQRVPTPPANLADLIAFATKHPGRMSYPRPPDFHGTTFLKQMLLDLQEPAQRAALYQSVTTQAFAQATAPLWRTLDALHPHLWRAGKQFPHTAAAIRQMMADGELLLAMTFNPNEAANEIAAKRLPASTVSFQFSSGTIGNTHFLGIPLNASAPQGAQVVANFLLGAQAQGRKADIAVWGDPTVLAVDRLSGAEKAFFPSRLLPGQLSRSAPALAEPHASWVDPLEKEWTRRYGT